MKKLGFAAAVAAGFLFSNANASIVDFAAFADGQNNPRGEFGLVNSATATGGNLIIGGVRMTLFGFDNNGQSPAFAYLDSSNASGPAGLGVCSTLDAFAQCNPASEDEIESGQSVQINFTDNLFTSPQKRDIEGLVFRDAGHQLIDTTNDGLVTITTENGTLTDLFSSFMALALAGDAFFKNTNFISFAETGTGFYVSIIDVSDIPLPGALPLLISGLAGLGFASRRRKNA